MQVTVKSILKNVPKDIAFFQPLFEAIRNSIDASATEIKITFDVQTANLAEKNSQIIGMEIIDNGEGFTKKNRDAFNELWTTNKFELGCKGSGRFTFLKVFDYVSVESNIVNNNENVQFLFDNNFNGEYDICDYKGENNQNLTKLKFSMINEKYRTVKERFYNLVTIKKLIIRYLLINFFDLKSSKRKIKIDLIYNDEVDTISNNSIPSLLKHSFFINKNDANVAFDLYYIFNQELEENSKICLCANGRTILIKDHFLNYTLPDNNIFTGFIVSNYLDMHCSDSRNSFDDINVENDNLFDLISLNQIISEARKITDELISLKFASIAESNKEQIKLAIKEAPHLVKYFDLSADKILRKENILKSAYKKFNDTKIKAKSKYADLLKKSDIDPLLFDQAINDITEAASTELAEYVVYRDSILKALDESVLDKSKKEKFLHNIIAPIKTTSTASDKNKHLLSNLWIFDDKFMSYSRFASDKDLKIITKRIKEVNGLEFNLNRRPDLFVAFNREDGKSDVAVFEFKGLNASPQEKDKIITEVPNNISAIRDNCDTVDTMWAYSITKIDERLKTTIINQHCYKKLIMSEGDVCAYYRYMEDINCHVYIVDIRYILRDAKLRNSTFINLLNTDY